MDILVLDTLLSGPFRFDRISGGATIPQLCTYLGLTRAVIKRALDALKGDSLLCSSTQFEELEQLSSDDDSSSDGEGDGGGFMQESIRAADKVRYFINFKTALPIAIITISKAFVSMASVESERLDGLYESGASTPNKPSFKVSCSVVYCPPCGTWVNTKHLKGGFVCPKCQLSILAAIGAEAKRVWDALKSRTISRRSMLTPQQLSLEGIFSDRSALQQLQLWSLIQSQKLIYTDFEREAVNPESYMTEREYADLQEHLQQASGLISPAVARAFQLKRSAQGHPLLKIETEAQYEKEAALAKTANSKLEKRSRLPPWMIVDELAHKAAVGTKRPREQEVQVECPPSPPYVPKFRDIARAHVDFHVIDL